MTAVKIADAEHSKWGIIKQLKAFEPVHNGAKYAVSCRVGGCKVVYTTTTGATINLTSNANTEKALKGLLRDVRMFLMNTGMVMPV